MDSCEQESWDEASYPTVGGLFWGTRTEKLPRMETIFSDACIDSVQGSLAVRQCVAWGFNDWWGAGYACSFRNRKG